jgi:nitrite reductase/ring-hydroxylating ferredoxin subunit
VCEEKQKKIDAEYQGLGERVEKMLSETPTIICPLHGWEYEFETGEHVGHPDIELPTYDVVVREGEVHIDE